VLHLRREVSRPPLRRRRELLRALFEVGAEIAVGLGTASEPDDREVGRDGSVAGEVRDRRRQQPPGQVARSSEDDQGTRRPDLLFRLPGRDRLGGPGGRVENLGSRLSHSGLTAWPPNWLRSAAMTFAEKDSSCREEKRAKRASARVGTGTERSIASWR